MRFLIESGTGASVYDIAERCKTSVRTAQRYIEALRRTDLPLYEDWDGARKIFRVMPTARRESLSLSTSQMLTLYLSRRVFDFLAGTGFKEDLDELFERLEVTLKRRDFQAARNLERKIFDVNEAPHRYTGRIEHVGEILTALLKEQRVDLIYESAGRGPSAVRVDPYTLVVYKKGLYLAGFSHQHGSVRLFALDSLRDVTWRRSDSFNYPSDWDPAKEYAGSFGLIRGEPVEVRLLFSEKVARFVERRRWHPSQRQKKVTGGLQLSLQLQGTTELLSWILGFGAEVQVLAPASLRKTVAEELQRALKYYSQNS